MKPNVRVGLGFDFHTFQDGRKLFLGGVLIPDHAGLKGHSDADVVLHAVADALLGAAGLGDIGTFFPDSDPQFRGIASTLLLEEAMHMLGKEGFWVGNVDVVIVAEQPRIQPHVEAIRQNLARLLHVEPGDIGVKATTMEGRGSVGRREGMAVTAVVLIYSSS